MKIKLILAIFAGLSLQASAAQAAQNGWSVTGPGGGSITALAVQGGTSQVVLLGSTNKLYRSADGGANWVITRDTVSNTVNDILFLPSGTRAYAAGGGLHRSDDAGQTWTYLELVPGAVGALRVGLNPGGANTLFAVGNDARIYRSSDASQANVTWTQLPTPPWIAYASVTSFNVDPVTPDTLYIGIYGTGYGLFKSVDGGVTWIPPAVNDPGTAQYSQVNQVVVKPGDSNVVLAATSTGLFYSTNGGTSWAQSFVNRPIFSAAFDPANTNNVVIGTFQGQIYRSDTGGATFSGALTGPLLGAQSVPHLVFGPGTPQKLFAASSEGVLISTNGGAAFTASNNGIREESLTSVGIADDGTTYMSFAGPSGVYRRTASGFQPVNNVNLRAAVNTTYDMQLVSPAPLDSQRLFVQNGSFALVRSLDGGATWSGPAPEFFISRQIWALARDPAHIDTAYIATAANGVWRTINGGATWTQRSTRSDIDCPSIQVDPVNTDILYAGCSVADTDFGVYKSVNAGQDWTLVAPSSFGFPKIVGFDPEDHATVFATFSFSLQKTTNAGASWTPLSVNLAATAGAQPGDLLIDPALPTTMFASFYNQTAQGFARTVDGGASWQFVRWQGGWLGPRVAALNPQLPNMIIMGSTGSGVHEYEVAPDLRILHTGFDALFATGVPAAATISVFNASELDASGAQVRVTFPAWLTPSVPSGCTYAANTLTCRPTALRGGTTRNIPVTLTASSTPAGGQVSFVLEGHETDVDPSSNTATVNIQSAPPTDLVLEMPASLVLSRTQGATLQLTATNRGPSASTNTRLSALVPAGLTATSATTSTGTCTITGGAVSCALGTLAANASANVTLSIVGNTINSHVIDTVLSGDGADTNNDQRVLTTIYVTPFADVALTLAESAGTKTAGVSFTYTATIRNNGPDAVGATVRFLTTGVSVANATFAGGTCASNTNSATCDMGSMASGASIAVQLNVSAPAAGNGLLEGFVTLQSADSNTANNNATLGTTIVTAPSTSSSSSGGGGGGGKGGGRFDWLAVALLALLTACRFNLSRNTVRIEASS